MSEDMSKGVTNIDAAHGDELAAAAAAAVPPEAVREVAALLFGEAAPPALPPRADAALKLLAAWTVGHPEQADETTVELSVSIVDQVLARCAQEKGPTQ